MNLVTENSNFLPKELYLVNKEVKDSLIDSIYNGLLKKVAELQDNSESSDVQWLAKEIYCECNYTPNWDTLPRSQQQYWRDVALACLSKLPSLLDRIANRYLVQAEVLRSLMKAEN